MMTTDWTDRDWNGCELVNWRDESFRDIVGRFVFIDDNGYHCGEHWSCGAIVMDDRRFVTVQVPDCKSPIINDHIRLYDVKGCWPVDHPAVKEAFWKTKRMEAWGDLKALMDNLDEDALTLHQLGTLASEVQRMVGETKAKEADQ